MVINYTGNFSSPPLLLDSRVLDWFNTGKGKQSTSKLHHQKAHVSATLLKLSASLEPVGGVHLGILVSALIFMMKRSLIEIVK